MKAQPLINVKDVRRSAGFYSDLLGAHPGHGGEDYEQVLVAGQMVLQIHASASDDNHDVLVDTTSPRGNGVVLWFETDDFSGTLDRIAQHGIQLDREPFENVYARQMECWLHDPDGYQVVIAGPSPFSRQPLPTEEESDARANQGSASDRT